MEKKSFKPSVGLFAGQYGFSKKLTEDDIKLLHSLEEGQFLNLQSVESDNPKAPAFRLSAGSVKKESDSL